MLCYSVATRFVLLLSLLLWNPRCRCLKYSASVVDGSKCRPIQCALTPNTFTFVWQQNNQKCDSIYPLGKRPLSAASRAADGTETLEPGTHNVQKLLSDFGLIEPSIMVNYVSRLKYNEKVILDTFAAAKQADEALTGNSFDNDGGQYFIRFDGDEGAERMLVASKAIHAGKEVANVPEHLCTHLSQIKRDLVSSYNSIKNKTHKSSSEAAFLKHVERLSGLSIGQFMKDATVSNEPGTFEGDTGTGYAVNDGHAENEFERRLTAFVASKRLQLLKTLIIADSMLSVGDAISVALGSKDFALAHVNQRERELLLLTLAVMSEYHMAVFSTVVRMLHDPTGAQVLSDADTVRLSWTQHLLTKNMEHLPLLMPASATKQIQESVVSHRLNQRRLAANDVLTAAADPLYVVQDRIEYLAKAHYKLEDTAPLQSGCGPLMSNRKIKAEKALEEMESELLDFETHAGQKKLSGLFQVGKEDMEYVLGGHDDALQEPDGDSVCLLGVFEDYLAGVLEPGRYRHVSHNSWLQAINSLVTQAVFTRLFATIVAHVVRVTTPGNVDVGAAYTEQSFLHNGAPGIAVSPVSDPPGGNHAKDTLGDEAYIVPMIDMVNHNAADPNCLIEIDASHTRGFKLRARRDIQPGEELTVNYGDLDHNVLFLDYGVVPPLDQTPGVLMEVEPALIKSAAESRDLRELLPRSFPAGLAPEKRELLKKLNMIEIPSDRGFLQFYNEPCFAGMPVEKYNEFAAKFLARRTAMDPSAHEEVDVEAIRQERSEFQAPTVSLFPYEDGEEQAPLKLVRVGADGVPDERLIPVLKICFCKTKKRLQWIAEQPSEYLATSINSPLDIEIFKMASFICCEYIKSRYRDTVMDDLRRVANPELFKIDCPLEAALAGALRREEPLRSAEVVVCARRAGRRPRAAVETRGQGALARDRGPSAHAGGGQLRARVVVDDLREGVPSAMVRRLHGGRLRPEGVPEQALQRLLLVRPLRGEGAEGGAGRRARVEVVGEAAAEEGRGGLPGSTRAYQEAALALQIVRAAEERAHQRHRVRHGRGLAASVDEGAAARRDGSVRGLEGTHRGESVISRRLAAPWFRSLRDATAARCALGG
ncbi:SET domain containing protein [Babesia caballi]|uniref:SET domain containing protein n=1 Tax=Babesia caballi TaxID=5871 RepID=A0AAV4LYD3_BABCB|nr:SET domain containing protein [Babesia caballi]